MCWIKDAVSKNTVKEVAADLFEKAIGAFLLDDPKDAKDLAVQLLHLPSAIRDDIYWENFYAYLINVYDFDDEGHARKTFKLKLAELLAEQAPNVEAGYGGYTDKLRENVKRLIKLIDDAGTEQKVIYYANLTRAALNENIDRKRFFKLCNCVRNLTEEDLLFLIEDIQKINTSTINEDRDNIDDFRAVGLLKEVEGGFSYSLRAFELLKYGLMYEKEISIPEDVQSRMMMYSPAWGGFVPK